MGKRYTVTCNVSAKIKLLKVQGYYGFQGNIMSRGELVEWLLDKELEGIKEEK